MRIKTLLAGGIAAAALAIALTGCSTQSGSSSASSSTQHTTAAAPSVSVNVTGTFHGLNGKKVSGDVKVTGKKIVLSDFTADDGPDLHLYLTNGTTESDVNAGTEISRVSYDTTSQTFMITGGADVSKYTNIVVHCDKAKAVFGAAKLSS